MQSAAAATSRRKKKRHLLKFVGFKRQRQQQQIALNPSSDETDIRSSPSALDQTPALNGVDLDDGSVVEVWYDARQRGWKLPHLFPKCLRRPCGLIVEDERFQMFIVLLILINSAMMGVATYDIVEEQPEVMRWFRLADFIFLTIFTIELGLQFIHKDIRIFLDGWLIFDLVVVVLSWAFSSMQIMRAFRIFRAFRLIGRIELLRSLVDACLSVVPRLLSIALLLFLVFYIFGVMFTQLFMEYGEYFGRLDVTLFTLFQMMTMDGWADIAREVMNDYKWAWVPFVSFVIISGFVVVNLIIAVICDAIFVLHEKDEEKENAKAMEENGGQGAESDSEAGAVTQLVEKKRSLEEEMEDLTKQVDAMLGLHNETRLALEELIEQLKVKK